jgi:hypothetical protein
MSSYFFVLNSQNQKYLFLVLSTSHELRDTKTGRSKRNFRIIEKDPTRQSRASGRQQASHRGPSDVCFTLIFSQRMCFDLILPIYTPRCLFRDT